MDQAAGSWLFLLILAISAVRQIARSLAWTLCMEAPHRLRFRDAFRARVMGDAIGNILPFASFVISEPALALIRDRVPFMAGLSAIAIENIFYSLSVAVFIFSGMVALLLSFSLPKGLRIASIVTLAVILLVIGVGCLLISKQLRFLSGGAGFLHRRGLDVKWVEKGRTLEDRIYGFYQRSRSRFLPILLLEACFHLAGACEIYVTLSFISPLQPPTFLTAFILESVNRVITVAFKFVPLRMGVDRCRTGKVSKVLQFAEVTGVTLAIGAKARDIFWSAGGHGAARATRSIIAHCGPRRGSRPGRASPSDRSSHHAGEGIKLDAQLPDMQRRLLTCVSSCPQKCGVRKLTIALPRPKGASKSCH